MADAVVIRGQRLTLRPLRPAEIDAEWQAMISAGAIAVAVAVAVAVAEVKQSVR